MKTSLTSAFFAATFLAAPTQVAALQKQEHTNKDIAICAPIFAKLEQKERNIVIAQAETPDTSKQTSTDNKQPDESELATQLSEMLQACSYDGKALAIDSRSLKASSEARETTAVQTIMRFTGLPQNFKIVEADVPNAAAMVVMGPDGIPQRIIAYNKQFMQQVQKATNGDDWPAISIMAHEIGHHLSGHTLIPGGSQPPIELEADKFSGFVLFKMGAKLDDAQASIATLVPEADSSTHPGKKKRLIAVKSGWVESCEQQRDQCLSPETIISKVEPAQKEDVNAGVQPGAVATLPDIPGAADIAMPGSASNGTASKPAELDHIPQLDSASTPSKFDRFVYDGVGIFTSDAKNKLTRIAYQFAAATNVEIVTIVVNDLHGKTADQYALDAMRQLRVGKLDVGNGAVLVVSPATKQSGVALGAGLLVQYDNAEPLQNYLKGFFKVVEGGGKTLVASSLIADASYRIMRDTKSFEWTVRFNSLDEMLATAEKARAEIQKSGSAYDPKKDPTWRKLLRIDAKIISKNPDVKDTKLDINEPKTRYVGPAMHVRTAGGKDAVLYVNPNVPALMPVELVEGKTYAFISRDSFLAGDTPQFDLISYDLLD